MYTFRKTQKLEISTKGGTKNRRISWNLYIYVYKYTYFYYLLFKKRER